MSFHDYKDFFSSNLYFITISAEKKSSKKPQRFTSGLPDSQELMAIKNKKKVTPDT